MPEQDIAAPSKFASPLSILHDCILQKKKVNDEFLPGSLDKTRALQSISESEMTITPHHSPYSVIIVNILR